MDAACVASRGTIVIFAPDCRTISAASGSMKILNSEAKVVLTWLCPPPMMTISSIFSSTLGSQRNSNPKSVKGPTATIVTGSPEPRIVSEYHVMKFFSSGLVCGAGKSKDAG